MLDRIGVDSPHFLLAERPEMQEKTEMRPPFPLPDVCATGTRVRNLVSRFRLGAAILKER